MFEEVNWNDYPNFSEKEFKCKHTGKCEMDARFIRVLQAIRDEFGKPITITSGYRDKTHPVEARKSKPGEHTYGLAADIGGSPLYLLNIIYIAYNHGIRRIGVNFSAGFVHLGMGDFYANFPKTPWDYNKGK